MPAIDLARLRKQAARLAEFFFVPDEFLRHLRELLNYYVNRTMRKQSANAPGSNLPTYRTHDIVIKQIEQEISKGAGEYPEAALELADLLWDEGFLETRLLAAFLLGRIPPQESHLLPRLTAWTQQIRDANLLAELLDTSLARMRKETPDQFLQLVSEWLQPKRTRLWQNGIQTAISAVTDPAFVNLPALLKLVAPVIEAAPAKLQNEIEELVLVLYQKSPSETTYFLRQVLTASNDPLTAITFRRISSAFPQKLKDELSEFIRVGPR